MATTDKANFGLQLEAQTFGRACEAHDLKRILTDIADQIADADQRHSEALVVMQQRLAALGSEAKTIRQNAPEAMAPAIARIEDRMAVLSDRLADSDDSRRSTQEPAERALHTTSHDVFAADPPMALRSASAADGLGSFTSRKDGASRKDGPGAAAKALVDPFDVVGSDGASVDGEPWDAASAEALTRLYERGDAGLTSIDAIEDCDAPDGNGSGAKAASFFDAPQTLDPHQVSGQAHAGSTTALDAHVQAAPSNVVALTPPTPSTSDERVWLEVRFAEVAQKLEQSFAGLRADGTLQDLSARFATLEDRLGSVMGQAVTRSDLSGLKTIELQVDDLTARLDAVQTHFSRLDTIELELRSLAEHINEDNLTRLFQRATPRVVEVDAADQVDGEQLPRIESALKAIAERLSEEKLAKLMTDARAGQPDVGAMAALVASKLAEQMPTTGASADVSLERIDDLRTLLNGFIDEQRHGDEQTTTMLDTMQQAMIRLLDRMDAIETGAPGQIDAAQFAARSIAAHHALPPRHDEDEPHESAEPKDKKGTAANRHNESNGHEGAVSGESLSGTAAARDAKFPYEQQHEAVAQLGLPQSAAVSSQANSETARDADSAGATSLNRDDFVAAARRAARQAGQQRAAEMNDSTEPVVLPIGGKSSAQAAIKLPRVGAKAAGRGGRQPSALTLVLLSLITVGVTFMLAKPYIESMARQGLDNRPIEQKIGPAGASGKAAAAGRSDKFDNNDGDEMIEGGTRPGASPAKRSSYPGGTDRDDTDGTIMTAALPPETTSVSGRIEDGVATSGAIEMPPLTIGPNSMRVAASKGDPSAQFEVGARFAEGKGVTQDLKQAVVWYQRSATQGFATAQYRLASMFERGLGAKLDFAKAMLWYQRAAEQGNVKAMHNLAVLNAGREGVAADYPVAARWFTMAADYGVTDSQFNLAIMHETGLGVEKSARNAYKWFSLAARSGDADASRRRDVVRAKLSPIQLREADAEIEGWRSKVADVSVNDIRVAGDAWKNRAN